MGNTLYTFLLFISLFIVAVGSIREKIDTKSTLLVPLAGEQREIRVAKSIEIDGSSYNISFNTILRTGYRDSTGEIFGAIKDIDGNLIQNEDGSLFICKSSNQGSGPDYTSIIQKDGKIYMITQFECGVGAIYIGELSQNSENGALKFKRGTLKYIDQSSEFGGWVHCAGVKTPWNSHLSSEEYEPDAKTQVDKSGKLTNSLYGDFLLKYWRDNYPNPYYYGWIPEIEIIDDEIKYKKHYAMGRFSHELAYVMPDNRTIYLSDDGTNGGLYMFIADRERDLSSGTLYGAKWIQKSAKNGGFAKLEWINLNHSTDKKVREVVATNPKFEDFFQEAKVDKSGNCPDGFNSINTSAYRECLKIRDGVDETILSRLETRRYSALKGVTTEFRKEEGITFDSKRNRLYVAISRIQYGMEDYKREGRDYKKYDIGGYNDIKLPYNSCGGVYALDIEVDKRDIDGDLIDSHYVVGNMYGLILGEMLNYPKNSPYAGNSCNVDKIAEPDNISYFRDTLLIGEDGSYHQNNSIWAYNLETKELNRLLSAPLGAETTSIFWHTNINRFSYISAVIQHPFGELKKSDINYNIDEDSYVGYIGCLKDIY